MDLVVTLIQKLISIIFYDIIEMCSDVSPAGEVVVSVVLIVYLTTEIPRRLNRRFGLGLRLLIVVGLRPTLSQHHFCLFSLIERNFSLMYLINNIFEATLTDLGIGIKII